MHIHERKESERTGKYAHHILTAKNIVYYILVCFCLYSVTGLSSFLLQRGAFLLIIPVILTAVISFLIDMAGVRRMKGNISYVKRVFFPVSSLLYYKFLLLDALISLLSAFLSDKLIAFEKTEYLVLSFFLFFVSMYMGVFRIFYVKESSEGKGRYVPFFRL